MQTHPDTADSVLTASVCLLMLQTHVGGELGRKGRNLLLGGVQLSTQLPDLLFNGEKMMELSLRSRLISDNRSYRMK